MLTRSDISGVVLILYRRRNALRSKFSNNTDVHRVPSDRRGNL